MSSQKNKKKPVLSNTPQQLPVSEPVDAIATNEDQLALQEEIIRWILSIFCALGVYLLVANIIKSVYHPDINVLLQDAQKLLLEPGGVKPEPVEAMLFRSGVVVILLSLLAFYTLFSKAQFIKNMAQKQTFLVISGICVVVIAAMIWLDFSALNPFFSADGSQAQNARDMTGRTNFDFYFGGFFLGKYLLFYTFILVPLIACLFFLGIKKYHWENNKLFNKSTNIIGYAVFGGVVLASVAMSVFYFPYAFETKYNFNAVYYSMTQVNAGSPMLVHGFSNTYGLYPEFLNIIFHFIGLSVLKFTSVMAILIGLAFITNFYALRQFVSNNVILFLGVLTVIFFPFLDFKYGQNFDCNFALYPIRYIIPSTLIFLATLYFNKRSQIVYWTTFVVSAFLALWNPEIGLVGYISWILVNVFFDFYSPEGKINGKKILSHLGIGVGVIVLVFYSYKLLILAIYGASPDLGTLFSTIQVFGKVGFDMLPMSLVHPWNITALILILSFVYAISKWYKKEITPKVALIFMVSFLGLGFFAYFQGRSHNWQLAQSSSMCLILLTLMGDDLWKIVKKTNILFLNALFVIFLFLISFSIFEIVFNVDRINQLVSQEDDKTKQQEEQTRIENNNDFIQKNSKEGEKIYVFTARQYQGLYFDGNKRVSAFNPGLGELFLISDRARLEQEISDSAFSVFIEPAISNLFYMARPFACMAASYEFKGVNQSMVMLEKRKTKIPQKAFFENTSATIFHRKYSDDTTGIRLRANDAEGTTPVNLGTTFSVEILFNSKTQIYQYASLVGNMNDSSGFVIANIINSPNYFFGINGKGFAAPIPNNEWVYCVMNVYPDHIEVYSNGNLVGTLPLAQPIRRSPEKLFIGNVGFMRYYIGAISEVAINTTVKDKGQVQATWDAIKGM